MLEDTRSAGQRYTRVGGFRHLLFWRHSGLQTIGNPVNDSENAIPESRSMLFPEIPEFRCASSGMTFFAEVFVSEY